MLSFSSIVKSDKKPTVSYRNVSFEDISTCPLVKCIDKDDNLSLYNYTTCSDEDPEYVKSCRGLVFNTDNELVVSSYTYTPEYLEEDIIEIKDRIGEFWKEMSCFDSYEGTIIRIFYYNKWYISTHKSLNAFKRRWALKDSFGQLFEDSLIYEYETNDSFQNFLGSKESDEETILERFFSKLNQEYQYYFLLKSRKENRIATTEPTENFILHVETRAKVDNSFEKVSHNLRLKTPDRHVFDTCEDLCDFVHRVNPRELQGVIIFTPRGQIKVYNKMYHYLASIRGNEKSIRFRYIQLRTNIELREQLFMLYPEMIDEFNLYENIIYEYVKNTKSKYVETYIKKEKVPLTKEELFLLRQCHAQYKQGKKVQISMIMDIINEKFTPPTLNKIIKHLIFHKRTHENVRVEKEKLGDFETEETEEMEEPEEVNEKEEVQLIQETTQEENDSEEWTDVLPKKKSSSQYVETRVVS